jgi:hypothetical protein
VDYDSIKREERARERVGFGQSSERVGGRETRRERRERNVAVREVGV